MKRHMWLIALCVLCLPCVSFGQETVDVLWDSPTKNTDGTPLLDLKVYNLYMDFKPIPDNIGDAQLIAEVPAGTVMATVDVALPGVGSTVYFRVSVLDTSLNESKLSNEIFKDFLASVAVTIRFRSAN